MAKNKKTIVPPSLQPRKTTKKTIPGSTKAAKSASKKTTAPVEKTVTPPAEEVKTEIVASSPTPPPPTTKTEKKRFTLWLDAQTYQAFKVHVAMNGGKGSDYIESLIKNDLKL